MTKAENETILRADLSAFSDFAKWLEKQKSLQIQRENHIYNASNILKRKFPEEDNDTFFEMWYTDCYVAVNGTHLVHFSFQEMAELLAATGSIEFMVDCNDDCAIGHLLSPDEIIDWAKDPEFKDTEINRLLIDASLKQMCF